MEWIPVKERLPDPYVTVLVSGVSGGLKAVNLAFYKERKWYCTYDWKQWGVDIEAWMPLPDPYYEGEKYGP